MYSKVIKHILLTLAATSFLVDSAKAEAKSLYVLDHYRYLTVFNTNNNQLVFQAQIDLPEHGLGPIDVAIDNETGVIFISYESRPLGGPVNVIEMYNTSLCHIGTAELNGPSDIAGLVYDKTNSRLIATERNKKKIWLIDWDTETLILDTTPSSVHLEGMKYGAAGLSLNGNTLYVSDYPYPYNPAKRVYLYDMNDNFNLIEPISMGNKVVGITYSSKDDVIYGGAYDYEGTYHHLIKRSIDPNTTIEKNIGAGTIGVTTDNDTGLVYLTTYRNGGSIEVYDASGWTGTSSSVDPNFIYNSDNDDNVLISNLAGLAIGTEIVPPFDPNVTDDIEGCVSPCDGMITYTITLSQEWAEEWIPHMKDFDKFRIVDELPDGLDFPEELNDPNWQYSAGSRTATYWIHDPNTWNWSDSINLTLKVSRKIAPGRTIKNIFKGVVVYNMSEDEIPMAEVETEVCNCSYVECGQVIYVDFSAEGNNDGSTWLDAYTTLQKALAESWPCDEIWVAQGTYKPTDTPSETKATFRMVSGVGIYGGFEGGASGEEHRYERNWFDKETYLSGYISQNELDCVVTSDANAPISIIDGFTITGGSIAGIYCENSSPIMQHNKITTNGSGIYCFESEKPVIKNNWIYRNDYGIYFDNTSDVAIVRNNTLVYNDEIGIFFESGIKPLLTNCILWGNGDESVENQLNWDYTTGDYLTKYSCIQDSNDVTPQPPYHTINTDPCFAGAATDDYHLQSVSPCIDKGDPNGSYAGERDIDKHFRVLNGNGENYNKRVDMGADEYCNQGSDNDADFNDDGNGDGIVNYIDFAIFSKAWLSEQGDDNWNPYCDISELTDNVIDANDLIVFAQEWLWMTCEKMEGIPMEMMMMGMGGGMGKMAGGESMLISETATAKAATQQQISEAQPQDEPSVEEQIAQAKRSLNFWLREDVREGMEDKDLWLRIVTDLEERLKELEDSQ